jgi:GATA-binding protein, other eukaryote
MKSDVIRKRSRHDARRMSSSGGADTPSASPGASRRASPVPETSPVLAPDSTTQMNYDYGADSDFHSSASELMGALGGEHHQGSLYGPSNSLASASSSAVVAGNGNNVFNPFPGPYHPDYLTQNYVQTQPPSDALPFASVDAADMQESLTAELGRTAKRRRMSVDSASEPPSSAVSYSSYTDGGASSSRSSSMDFNFGFYQSGYPILRSSAAAQAQNAFWHPPMLPQTIMDSPQMFHPPMLPPAGEDSAMDYLHSSATTSSASSSSLLGSGVTGTNGQANNGPGAVHGSGAMSSAAVPSSASSSSSVAADDDSLFATYLHPPMLSHEEQTPSAGGNASFNSPRMPHPPMFQNEGMYYESSGMQSY